MTQAQAAADLEFNLQKVSRFETGQLPGFHELRALLDLYDVLIDEWDTYLSMWRRANAKYWWHRLRLNDYTYFSMEHEASAIRDFQNTHLPVLLRTERYAESLLSTSVNPPSKPRLDNELTALAFRQNRLDEHPVSLHCLIYVSILHVGGVDHDQLKYLLLLSVRDNVTIQVVPVQPQPLGILQGSFTLLSFPDADEPDLAQVEHPVGPTPTQDLEKVGLLSRTFAALLKYAMSPEDSRDYIENLVTG